MARQALMQQQSFVTILYDGLLGRAPSASETQSWTKLINAGVPEATIAQNFLNSAEYQSSSSSQFVTSLYQNLFDRTPASAEVASWRTALASGASPAQVVTAIDQSPEARQDFASRTSGEDSNSAFVTVLYQGLLGRTATSAEVQGWANVLSSGQSPTDVAQDILNSAEYRGISNAQFVQGLYQSFLGRTASSTEALGWTTTLANGSSRAQVVAGFGQAPEAQQYWRITITPSA